MVLLLPVLLPLGVNELFVHIIPAQYPANLFVSESPQVSLFFFEDGQEVGGGG